MRGFTALAGLNWPLRTTLETPCLVPEPATSHPRRLHFLLYKRQLLPWIDGFAKATLQKGHVRSVEMLRDALSAASPSLMHSWRRSTRLPSGSELGGEHMICSGPCMAVMTLDST